MQSYLYPALHNILSVSALSFRSRFPASTHQIDLRENIAGVIELWVEDCFMFHSLLNQLLRLFGTKAMAAVGKKVK